MPIIGDQSATKQFYSIQYTNVIYEFNTWSNAYTFARLLDVLTGGRVFYDASFVKSIENIDQLKLFDCILCEYKRQQIEEFFEIASKRIVEETEFIKLFGIDRSFAVERNMELIFLTSEFGSYAVVLYPEQINLLERVLSATNKNERKVAIDLMSTIKYIKSQEHIDPAENIKPQDCTDPTNESKSKSKFIVQLN